MPEQEKNFINYHVLISHSPSCLNRDDMNMQKSAVFGGVRRTRVSSQCLKRAMRKNDYFLNAFGAPSDRTRNLEKVRAKYIEALAGKFDDTFVTKAIGFISGKKDDEAQADAVAPWSIKEVAWFCERIQQLEDEGLDEKKLAKVIEKESAGLRRALAGSADIALYGRMATSGLMSHVDGALSVAHSITTHAVDSDIDWFTAVDDLVEEAGDVGAGHLNTQEFSAGVFYRYASLNIGQLRENMGDVERSDALAMGAHLLHLLATVTPEAKQRSFAAHNPADFVLVSFSDMPLSLANAFEEPVARGRQGGLSKPSLSRLIEYHGRVYKGFGLKDRTAAFSLAESGFAPLHETLTSLEDWVRNNGEA